MLGTSAAVQAAVASTPTLATVTAAGSAASPLAAGGESVTSSGDGGMEFTLDAATLEQLRGAGDASALMESSAAAAVGFGEMAPSDDQPTMQVDGSADDDDWMQGLVQLDGPTDCGLTQLDGPMDSDDVAGDDGDEEAGGEVAADGQEEQEQGEGAGQGEGADGAEGGFDAEGLDSAAEGSTDVVDDAGFASAADELSAAAASAGFTAAELSSHTAALDADDPAAAYMMQVQYRLTIKSSPLSTCMCCKNTVKCHTDDIALAAGDGVILLW